MNEITKKYNALQQETEMYKKDLNEIKLANENLHIGVQEVNKIILLINNIFL